MKLKWILYYYCNTHHSARVFKNTKSNNNFKFIDCDLCWTHWWRLVLCLEPSLQYPPRQLKILASHGSQGGAAAAAAGPVCFVTILIVSFCHSNLDQINLIELMNDTGNHKLLPRLYRHAVKKFDLVLLNLLLHIVSCYLGNILFYIKIKTKIETHLEFMKLTVRTIYWTIHKKPQISF